jgi:hypothetical protein
MMAMRLARAFVDINDRISEIVGRKDAARTGACARQRP